MEIYRELYQTSKDLPEFTNKVKILHTLMKQEDWRGEFESQFAASKMADPLDMNSEILISPERFASDATPKLVIRFIQSLLDQQKRELLEKRTLLDTSNINPPWFH